jgi:hypothetical protein
MPSLGVSSLDLAALRGGLLFSALRRRLSRFSAQDQGDLAIILSALMLIVMALV